MDWSVVQIVGLIVLGWIILSVVVAVAMAVFLRGAHRLERQLPTHRRGIRDWVRGKMRKPAA